MSLHLRKALEKSCHIFQGKKSKNMSGAPLQQVETEESIQPSYNTTLGNPAHMEILKFV